MLTSRLRLGLTGDYPTSPRSSSSNGGCRPSPIKSKDRTQAVLLDEGDALDDLHVALKMARDVVFDVP